MADGWVNREAWARTRTRSGCGSRAPDSLVHIRYTIKLVELLGCELPIFGMIGCDPTHEMIQDHHVGNGPERLSPPAMPQVTSMRWCYVHQQCADVMKVPGGAYEILEPRHGLVVVAAAWAARPGAVRARPTNRERFM